MLEWNPRLVTMIVLCLAAVLALTHGPGTGLVHNGW